MDGRVASVVEAVGLLLLAAGVGLAWLPGGLMVLGAGLIVAANVDGGS